MLFSSASFASEDLKQTHILSILRDYLESGVSKVEPHKKENFMQKSPKGYCSGISTAWLNNKWVQIKKTEIGDMIGDTYGPITKDEDPEWFQSTINLILAWEKKEQFEKELLDEEDINNIDAFIEKIEYFQHIHNYRTDIQQGELDKSLVDTNKGRVVKEYSVGSLLTLEQLKKLLKTENFIQEGRLVLITSHNHDTALFRGNLLCHTSKKPY